MWISGSENAVFTTDKIALPSLEITTLSLKVGLQMKQGRLADETVNSIAYNEEFVKFLNSEINNSFSSLTILFAFNPSCYLYVKSCLI